MGNWTEQTLVIDNEALGVETFEGTAIDLKRMIDKHATRFVVSSGGSPAFEVQLQGAWQEGQPYVVLATINESSVTLDEWTELLAVDRPARVVRVVCVVTSGSLTITARMISGE